MSPVEQNGNVKAQHNRKQVVRCDSKNVDKEDGDDDISDDSESELISESTQRATPQETQEEIKILNQISNPKQENEEKSNNLSEKRESEEMAASSAVSRPKIGCAKVTDSRASSAKCAAEKSLNFTEHSNNTIMTKKRFAQSCLAYSKQRSDFHVFFSKRFRKVKTFIVTKWNACPTYSILLFKFVCFAGVYRP